TILAVGAAQRRPVEAEDGPVKLVSQMTATLSCDHRVVDGALGAELLAAFKALIESPVRMLVSRRASHLTADPHLSASLPGLTRQSSLLGKDFREIDGPP